MFASPLKVAARSCAPKPFRRMIGTLPNNSHIYTFPKNSTSHYLTLLPSDPPTPELAIGTTAAIPPTPDSFSENPRFQTILQEVLKEHAHEDEGVLSQAQAFAVNASSQFNSGGTIFRGQSRHRRGDATHGARGDGAGGASGQGGAGGGGRGGWVHLSDSRNPPDYGRIAWPEDIFGSLEIGTERLSQREGRAETEEGGRETSGMMLSTMQPSQGYDDEELSISLAPSNNRRTQNKPPDASSGRSNRPREEVRRPAVPAHKAEQRIGAYDIKGTLGEGSFGKVKLAVHRVTQQQVALKIIARKKLISRDMAGRVEREIEYLQLLRHPHIIKLYTVIKTQTEIIMVLEFAGGELFNYIVQHGKMTETKARRFFQQIICAVEYCHRHKIVHRDLKPENLLLDNDLNVKIADFGLSNIMTDGNFLKTSCGSPNYAAPEVINGKLYAGPEVDVWSCGVILYVLLVGRLPFDDDNIPALFAKIAKGHYVVPNYMTPGAASLIKKMLAVNPVHRVTIEEIRQDPWFLLDLPTYLKPPVEEFMDTGVDSGKAINPQGIAPGASRAVQEKLHDAVTEKLGKKMGYGKQDVQEALEADEPSAIKDAYLIVRENTIAQANPNINALLGSSPPAWDEPLSSLRDKSIATVSQGAIGSGDVDEMSLRASLGNLAIHPSAEQESSRSGSINTVLSGDRPVRPFISKIGILPSSLPAYHRAYMEARKAGKDVPSSSPKPDVDHVETNRAKSSEEQAETARRLNPHSRNQLKLEEGSNMPAAMTPVPQKKSKPTKWQFGIRSRNQPLEAIGCIYRALKKLGAEWVVDENYRSVAQKKNDNERQQNRSFGSNDSDSDDGGPLHRFDSQDSIAKDFPSPPGAQYKLPADPWVLRVRWRKGGMYAPGTVPPGSTHSSQIDLRRQSLASMSSVSGSGPLNDPEEGVVMHLDIQLYEMEQGVYLVDFKCAGYETATGVMLEEKDVTSPFPFLDLSSTLIIALAEAD
ncbi:hypothetical protein V496_08602 [Pseudogymnoascus sp. VKM F-4515 (FW-2607)]|nr:hypothetical protein V496_08602 [Pseudogymnoascus sp. VKM F-4515 (FW-2607)]KFZ00040.1 hypothetical protein V498_00344 [Pseudogymnoascus sp. VKM F-4517 (FW-2822)]